MFAAWENSQLRQSCTIKMGGLTIINVIQQAVRVEEIVDHHRTTQTIAVLRRQMRMIPERAGLPCRLELIQERMSCCQSCGKHGTRP